MHRQDALGVLPELAKRTSLIGARLSDIGQYFCEFEAPLVA